MGAEEVQLGLHVGSPVRVGEPVPASGGASRPSLVRDEHRDALMSQDVPTCRGIRRVSGPDPLTITRAGWGPGPGGRTRGPASRTSPLRMLTSRSTRGARRPERSRPPSSHVSPVAGCSDSSKRTRYSVCRPGQRGQEESREDGPPRGNGNRTGSHGLPSPVPPALTPPAGHSAIGWRRIPWHNYSHSS